MNHNSEHMIVLDLETTGLDLTYDRILEMAFLVVDFKTLTIRDTFSRVVCPSYDWEERLRESPDAFAMHTENGLIADVHNKGAPMEEILHAACKTLNKFSVSKQALPFILSGSCVACFDLPMLKVQFPEFAARFHYRPMDASIARAWHDVYGDTKFTRAPKSDHRALGDCLASLDLIRQLKESF